MVETTVSVQTLGIGVTSFISTLIMAFLFINAWRDNSARAFAYGCAGLIMWSWFGYFYQLTDNVELARQLRIISLIGETFFLILFVRFWFVHKASRAPLTHAERVVREVSYLTGWAFVFLFTIDIFGTSTLVGDVTPGALTPARGAFYDLFFLYFYVCTFIIAWLAYRTTKIDQGKSRRATIIIGITMVTALVIGSGGFAPWYGINTPILATLRALAVPLLGIGAYYAITNYSLFNLRVAFANIFVFGIWTFVFFRILLNPSFRDALPDIFLFVALVVLGVFLIRSIQRELDSRHIIERAEREKAVEQAKTEFISIAAHQLRTPLSGIRWTFNVLQAAGAGLTDEQRQLVAKGNERTKDVVERVNEMLRAARLTDDSFKIDRKRVDIRPIITDVVSMFAEPAKSKGLSLDASMSKKPLYASADKEKLLIALQNLVDNAIKYTKSGQVDISADAVGGEVIIHVHDTGIGITPTDREHLFEKFYRNERATKMFTDGSGLGLFIVKKIVDAHDGDVEVDSDGKGATFTIRLKEQKSAK